MAGARGSLLRVLGVGFGIAVAVGGGVVVGILRTPGAIAEALARHGRVITSEEEAQDYLYTKAVATIAAPPW